MMMMMVVPVVAGMAVANVLLPSAVKLHFPQRVGEVTEVHPGSWRHQL